MWNILNRVVVGCAGLIVGVAHAQSVTPDCAQRPATIYVDGCIVRGGPLNGHFYFGLLLGTGGDDVIVGTPFADLVLGNGGNDVVCGAQGNDVILAGRGTDQLDGGPGRDIGAGGNGLDVATPETEVRLSIEEVRPLTAFRGVNYYVDPADPRLLRVVRNDGTIIEYFGTRDAIGRATAATLGRVTFPNGTQVIIEIDAQGRPKKAVAAGITFSFEFTGTRTYVLSAVSPNGERQASVAIDLDNLPFESALLFASSSPLRAGGQPLAVSLANPASALAGLGSGRLETLVTRCGGQPIDDATVFVDFVNSSGSSTQLPATHGGGGLYSVNLPTESVDPTSFTGICNSIIDKIGNSCYYFSTTDPSADLRICAAIAAPFVATPIPGADEAAVFAGCEAVMSAGRIYCETLGASPGEGAPSLAESLCNLAGSAIDWFFEPEVEIQSRAFVPGNGIFESARVEVAATGPFPTLTIDAGGQLEITSFSTSPVDPAPGQGYVATVVIECITTPTTVVMSIVGTDGYSNSSTCQFQTNGTCRLSVPGAEAGVVDTVTVSVSGGPSRVVTLVF